MTDEIRQLEKQRKQPEFASLISKHFPTLELSENTIKTLQEHAIEPRVIKSLHSIDHHQPTPGMRWNTFKGGENLWYCRFSQKGRIYVQMRAGLKPLVTDIDYDKKLQ
jgi:hypothetical protein